MIPIRKGWGAVSPQLHRDAIAPVEIDVANLKILLEAAVTAATDYGASYADAHVRYIRREDWEEFTWRDQHASYPLPSWLTKLGITVRALVDGMWGVAGAGGMLTLDAAAGLGRSAAGQAKTVTSGVAMQTLRRVTELAPAPVVTGEWTTPIGIDPFQVSPEEKADYGIALMDLLGRQRHVDRAELAVQFMKEQRIFASSTGSYVTQMLFTTKGTFSLSVERDWVTEHPAWRSADFFSAAGAGWEYVRNAPFQDEMARMIDEARSAQRAKPIDVGRYDVVFDARSMAEILTDSIGVATQLDRALGYEANGVGTSYLGDPLAMLGTFKMGSPLLNVKANRSMPAGAATVQWDDEGVVPQDVTLVKDGILTDFQTTREGAAWLSSSYEKIGHSVRSNGCAGRYGVPAPVQQVSPNVILEPGQHDLSFENLVQSTKKGLAIIGWAGGAIDQQGLNGWGAGQVIYEITNGKFTGTVDFDRTKFLYRSPEFWRNLVAIGGPRSVRTFGFERYRDSELDRAIHTVSSPPAKVTGVAVTNLFTM